MTDTLPPAELGKRAAALKALDFVEDGMTLGLGTGSTAKWFVDLLAERIKAEGMRITGVPTSTRTRDQAAGLGIPLTTLDAAGQLDLTIDGADEFDPALNLIKGGGGALTREKIVAGASRKFVCIVDKTKRVRVLGAFPLPVEVIPMARSFVARKLVVLWKIYLCISLRRKVNRKLRFLPRS